MSTAPAPGLNRPKRWDLPFSDEITELDVERLLTLAPFREMNQESFPRNATSCATTRADLP